MTLSTRTLDLNDRIEEIEERLETIEEEKERIKTEVRQHRQEDETDEIPNDLEDEWEDLDKEEVELRGDRKKFAEVVEEWGGSEIVIEELSFGQLQAVSDDMMDKSFEVDVDRGDVEGTPQQGFYRIRLLEQAISRQPSGAPTQTIVERGQEKEVPSPGDYPIALGEWLFEKIDAFNTTGDTEMGNSSLKEAMKLSDSGRN